MQNAIALPLLVFLKSILDRFALLLSQVNLGISVIQQCTEIDPDLAILLRLQKAVL